MSQIERFHENVRPFLGEYHSIDLRVVARKINDVWLFKAIHAVLDTVPKTESIISDLPKVNNLLIVHKRLDVEELDKLLEAILKGEIVVEGNLVQIKYHDGQKFDPISSYIFRFYERADCQSKYGIDFASLVLEEGSSDNITPEEERAIDNQLRSTSPPWDGLADLLEHFVGYQHDLAFRSNWNTFEIVAPLYVHKSWI